MIHSERLELAIWAVGKDFHYFLVTKIIKYGYLFSLANKFYKWILPGEWIL